MFQHNSWDKVTGVVTGLHAGEPRNRGSIRGGDKRFSLLQTVHTDSWSHTFCCSVGTGRSLTAI
jgi:hypothetical protein